MNRSSIICILLLSVSTFVHSSIIFVCSPENDIFNLVKAKDKLRYDSLSQALEDAGKNHAVMVLADAYPSTTTDISEEDFLKMADLNIKLYVEYPNTLPNSTYLGAQAPGNYDRLVFVTDKVEGIKNTTAMYAHDAHFAQFNFTNPNTTTPILVRSIVSGYRTAVFGIQACSPALFRYQITEDYSVLVSTTKLSNVVTARYSPIGDWTHLWNFIFKDLDPSTDYKIEKWTPVVRPSYGRKEKLPLNAEYQSFMLATDWLYKKGNIFFSGARDQNGTSTHCPAPYTNKTSQIACTIDGYASQIYWNGTQDRSTNVRMDDIGPIAMALSYRYLMDGNAQIRDDVIRLLDYLFYYSEAQQGPRGDPKQNVYGLLAWGVSSPAWLAAFYGDADASCVIGSLVATSVLKSNRYDDGLVKNFLANLRTSNQNGFRPGRVEFSDLEKKGWEYFFNQTDYYSAAANNQPHYSSMLYAEFLWAYHHTGFDLFLNNTYTAIKNTMTFYPFRWKWTEYMSEEQAKFLISLAWLVRVKDTEETRGWLKLIATDLLSKQQDFGGVSEFLGAPGLCQFCPPGSNAAFGKTECGLIQTDGDPCTDMLYTHNFAVIGLREAYAATGDRFYLDAETKMIEFLIRIQARSEKHPYLDGAWLRAFDYEQWDFFGLASDVGWGPWSVEPGWSEAWISSNLAGRFLETSIWDITQSSTISPQLVEKYCPQFFTGKYKTICDEFSLKLRKKQ